MQTRVLPFSDESIAEAARLILAGEPVAVPTETVYGLAADATNAEAVARIYEAKGRPSFNPLIVHVIDFAAAARIGNFDEAARDLAERHWPGPLTLIVPLRQEAGIASIVTFATCPSWTFGMLVSSTSTSAWMIDMSASVSSTVPALLDRKSTRLNSSH